MAAKPGCPYCVPVQCCTLGNGLFLAPSNIPDAGQGVFAARDFRRGDCVTEYAGRILNRVQMLELISQKKHLWKLIVLVPDDKLFIDGDIEVKEGVPLGSLLNDARNSRVENVEFARDPDDFRLWVVAKRYIAAGEELFVAYGRNYWFEWANANNQKPKRVDKRPRAIPVPEQFRKCNVEPTKMLLDDIEPIEYRKHKKKRRHHHYNHSRNLSERAREFEEHIKEIDEPRVKA